MEVKEWIMIGAILLGPVLAVQAQKWLESLREQRSRKLWIFRTLMTTRANPVSPQHVEALNYDRYGIFWNKLERKGSD